MKSLKNENMLDDEDCLYKCRVFIKMGDEVWEIH